MNRYRLLTITDMHLDDRHYGNLEKGVNAHQPDLVACVGDFLCLSDPPRPGKRITVAEAADRIGHLPAPTVFTRGNHEEENWHEFVKHWPHKLKPLTCLHASSETFGPLTVIGFPCTLGNDIPWLTTLPLQGNTVTPNDPMRKALRQSPGYNHNKWCKALLRSTGPAGRACWLMHIPPAGLPICHPDNHNPWFGDLVTHYQPKLVISGHDHSTPLRNNAWYVKDGETYCLNAGQGNLETFYIIADFFFEKEAALPSKIEITRMPDGQRLII